MMANWQGALQVLAGYLGGKKQLEEQERLRRRQEAADALAQRYREAQIAHEESMTERLGQPPIGSSARTPDWQLKAEWALSNPDVIKRLQELGVPGFGPAPGVAKTGGTAGLTPSNVTSIINDPNSPAWLKKQVAEQVGIELPVIQETIPAAMPQVQPQAQSAVNALIGPWLLGQKRRVQRPEDAEKLFPPKAVTVKEPTPAQVYQKEPGKVGHDRRLEYFQRIGYTNWKQVNAAPLPTRIGAQVYAETGDMSKAQSAQANQERVQIAKDKAAHPERYWKPTKGGSGSGGGAKGAGSVGLVPPDSVIRGYLGTEGVGGYIDSIGRYATAKKPAINSKAWVQGGGTWNQKDRDSSKTTWRVLKTVDAQVKSDINDMITICRKTRTPLSYDDVKEAITKSWRTRWEALQKLGKVKEPLPEGVLNAINAFPIYSGKM
jgi:hypothetical protein